MLLQTVELPGVRDIGDVWLALEGGFETLTPAHQVGTPRLRLWQQPVAMILGVLAITAATSVVTWLVLPQEVPSVVRFAVTPPAAAPLLRSSSPNVAISPDGTSIVYTGGEGDQQRLYVHRLDVATETPLAGTESGQAPFFSPDSQWIGFWQGNVLKKVNVDGRPPERISQAWTTCSSSGCGDRSNTNASTCRVYNRVPESCESRPLMRAIFFRTVGVMYELLCFLALLGGW